MKKIFYLASIAALAFSSCTKDETAEVALGTVAGGEIIANVGDADTRAYLDSNQKFRWQDGDKLAVYSKGTYPMFNSTYAWKSGFTQGVFEGEKQFSADGNYLAVYPRYTTSLITETQWKDAWANGLIPGAPYGTKGTHLKLDANAKAKGVTLQVPAEQKYMPGSFYQDVVPAMSTTFDVQEDGNAEVDMQPVADYLFVNIKSTKPVKKLSLKLKDANDSSNFLKIAGQGNPTAYLQNGKVRYYLSNTGMDSEVINLVTNDYAADVTCHEPQTYVFVIPGGILGSNVIDANNKGIEAWIWVNEPDGSSFKSSAVDFIASSRPVVGSDGSLTANAKVVSNKQMNYYYSNNGTPYVSADDILTVRTYDSDETNQYPYYNPLNETTLLPAMTMQMENMYFWVNPLDNKGNRTSFTYNPDGDVIIENEAELLRYLTEYSGSDAKYAGKDAYICDNHHFDFSEANMKALSSELTNKGVYTEFQPYIDAYLNGSFPTIATYTNVFNGNDAVISGIVEPLKGMTGIFGNIGTNGAIVDVTFDGIEAAKAQDGAKKENVYPGVILGSMTGGSLSNVTVKNAEGMAVLTSADSENLSELTVEGVEGLNFIALQMHLAYSNYGYNNYTKSWATMSGVKEAVFGTLDAASGYEYVVLPAGADYADLAWYVGTNNATNAQNIYHIISGTANFVPVEANQDDNKAVSVFVGDTSIWTGDVTTTHTYGGSHTTNTNHAYYKYQCIESAEELAGAAANDANKVGAVLMTNMDMSYAVNSWEAPALNGILDGNGVTIKGISMDVEGATTFVGSYVAPFKAMNIKNLTVDGVSIKITTKSGQVVPQHIGGLAENANRVENVVVKNLAITGDGVANNNENYSTEYPSYIGWLVAGANNPTIKNSKVEGVDNQIKGIAALVGYVFITENNSSKFDNATASSVSTPQEQLANFWDAKGGRYNEAKHGNFAGTAVGLVDNSTSSAKSIEFTGSTGKPVFLYRTVGDINVLYDDSKVILKNGDEQYY